MAWKDDPISKLEITEGMQQRLAKAGFATVGDLAKQWEADKLEGLRVEFGNGGVNLLLEELRTYTGGESGKETPTPEPEPEPAAELVGAAAGGGTAAVPAFVPPEGQAVVSIEELSNLRADRSALDSIEALSDQLVAQTVDYKLKKDKALEAKKKMDSTTSELTNLIADRRRGQRRLPLAGDNAAADPPSGDAPADEGDGKKKKRKKAAAVEPVKLEGPDGWRGVPIDVLADVEGAQPKLIARLQKAKIKTIGAFEEMRAARAWPKGFNDNDRDHVIEIALNWLKENRDAAAFAGAAAASAERIEATTNLVVLMEPIVDDRQRLVHEQFKVMDAIQMKADDPAAGIGVMVNGACWQLDPQQFVPAPKAVKRPGRIILTRDLPGADTEDAGMFNGVEADVTRYVGSSAFVKTKRGEEVIITPADYDVLATVDVDVVPGMILASSDFAA